MNNFIEIGKVLKPKGIQGAIKIEGITDDNSRFLQLKEIFIDDKNYTVKKAKIEGNFVILKLNGIDTPEMAETLRNKWLSVKRDDAVIPGDDRNLIVDLIGLKVFVGNNNIGNLIDILQYGAADVYVVKSVNGEISFPALKRLIKQIDLNSGIMLLDEEVFKEVAIL